MRCAPHTALNPFPLHTAVHCTSLHYTTKYNQYPCSGRSNDYMMMKPFPALHCTVLDLSFIIGLVISKCKGDIREFATFL